MSFVIYGDFASPESYLASRRVDALVAAGVDVQWRAVESSPDLPVVGRPLGSVEIEGQIRRLGALLLKGETLPWSIPAIVPNTQAAVSAYAEAFEAGIADDVRRLLFAAYWVDGVNIGNADQLWPRLSGPMMRGKSPSYSLREYGYAIAVSRALRSPSTRRGESVNGARAGKSWATPRFPRSSWMARCRSWGRRHCVSWKRR